MRCEFWDSGWCYKQGSKYSKCVGDAKCGDMNINKFEKACKEWVKGCSNADYNSPEDCRECTMFFRNHIQRLIEEENEEN